MTLMLWVPHLGCQHYLALDGIFLFFLSSVCVTSLAIFVTTAPLSEFWRSFIMYHIHFFIGEEKKIFFGGGRRGAGEGPLIVGIFWYMWKGEVI